MKTSPVILPLIVLAQFMCTSLWFAGNAVMPDLISILDLQASDLGYVTSSVQFGFIVGTLFYAVFTVADRFNPSRVFFISALLGAFCNILITINGLSFFQILLFRFFTGFFLAGIYPVGMKIAADYYEKGLGKALSFLVGALVLGTALPHLISSFETSFSWKSVIYLTTLLAVAGGLMIWVFVGIGPYRKQGQKLKISSLKRVFSNRDFRTSAFGYFGHMWELYAFWAFVPIMLMSYNAFHFADLRIPITSFYIIAAGAVACVLGGFLSTRFGTKKVANFSLFFSGICCLAVPYAFQLSPNLFILFLLFWGMVVIADSPLFSTLVAQNAKPELKGTALTLVTCIGFAVTIVSIQLLTFLSVGFSDQSIYWMLCLGPLFGLLSQVPMKKETTSSSS